MRILFVKPNMGLVKGLPYFDRGRMEPLTFAVLNALTPKVHETALCDDRFEPIPYSERWDLVGINTEIYTARRAYEIADHFRRLGVAVVLGGYHVTMIPEESILHADAIIIGDADEHWPNLLEDFQAGLLKSTYKSAVPEKGKINNFNVNKSIFQNKKYLPVALTQFSRGCPNSCEYCATGAIYQKRHTYRPVQNIVEELEQDPRRIVFFVDDNIIADFGAAKELFRAITPLNIKWTGQASLNFVNDKELMDLMLESGCVGLVIGFESLNHMNLSSMKKNCNLPYENYDHVVEIIRSCGLLIWGAFLLGYDYETEQSIRETVDWVLSKKFAFAAFNILMPYPSTPFYNRMKSEGRLLYDGQWWVHDAYRFGASAFKPKNISPERLAEACLDARLRHNSVYQIFRRAFDSKTNSKDIWSLLTYFAYNPLFRDEMLKKHGMQLGYRGFERNASQKLIFEDRFISSFLETTRRGMTHFLTRSNN